MEQRRRAYRVLVGIPAGRRPSGKPRRGWEDNIKIDLREVGEVTLIPQRGRNKYC